MRSVSLKDNGIQQEPGIIYCELNRSSSSTCHMFPYLSTHITHICYANTRIKVVHTNLLCDCCSVAATKQRARDLEARCGTDIMQQQQHVASRANKKKRNANMPGVSTQINP